jgi:hypothetical protein
MQCDQLDEDLLDTIGLNGEDKLTSDVLIDQTRQLVNIFLGGQQTGRPGWPIFCLMEDFIIEMKIMSIL